MGARPSLRHGGERDGATRGVQDRDRPSLQSAIGDAVRNETFGVQVWIGVDDHLIRRISEQIDVKETAALLNAESQLPAPPAAESQQIVESRSSIALTFHDFNSAVTVTAPLASDVLKGR